MAGEAARGDYPVLPMDAATAAALRPSHETKISANAPAPNEYLLLQVVINDVEMDDVSEALQRGGKLYLPLGQVSEILDFPITVDVAARTAEGWFVREQNTFTLTPVSAEVKGKTIALPPGSVFAEDKDIYVDSDLLHEWFPLNFATDMHRMTLNITTREALPFQARKSRDKAHQRLAQQNQPAKDQTFKKIEIPYEAAAWPSVDLTFSPSYDSTSHATQSDYSMLAAGDFGYLTSRLYAAGDLGQNNVSDLRLSFGRDDYESKLLGPAHASSFRFGDVDSASLSQVATPNRGRGFTITNRALDRSDNFDVTNFIGDSKPGWEAELYRNGTLIAFQTVGSDGRYSFTKIPILFGNNQFRIVFYGPQGQVEEITKTVNAEASLLEKGQFAYNLSADEKNKSLLGVANQNTTAPSGLAGVGEFEYGLTRWLTLAAGGAHTVLPDGDHSYATSGLRTSVKGVLTALDGAYDTTKNGYSTRLSLSTDVHDTLLSFQQKVARHFESEENTIDLANPINRQTVARADKQINVGSLDQINASLSYTLKQYQSGRDETLWTNQLSKTFLDSINVTNTLQEDRDNMGLNQFTGHAFLRGYYKHVLLGGEVDYDLQPLSDLNRVNLSALYPLSETISDNLTLTSQIAGARSNTIANTATFDMGRYKLSLTGRASDQHDYFAGMTFNMSIGRIPDSDKWILSGKTLAETGIVAVRPYIDHNFNQVRDVNEAAPANAAIKIGSMSIKVDKYDTAIASQLLPNIPVTIRMDQDTLTNPFAQQTNWSASVDAYTVVPRPGKVIAVNYPLFETSQIDGTVSVPTGSSPAGLVVELVNTEEQSVRATHTAFDGYYLLDGLMPGTYKLRVADSSLSGRNLTQASEATVDIAESDFFVKDIQLIDATPPPPVVPPQILALQPRPPLVIINSDEPTPR